MDFECLEGKTLEHMRLLIEGAVVLYENDVMPLYSMAIKQKRYQEAAGWIRWARRCPAFRTIFGSFRPRMPFGWRGRKNRPRTIERPAS